MEYACLLVAMPGYVHYLGMELHCAASSSSSHAAIARWVVIGAHNMPCSNESFYHNPCIHRAPYHYAFQPAKPHIPPNYPQFGMGTSSASQMETSTPACLRSAAPTCPPHTSPVRITPSGHWASSFPSWL